MIELAGFIATILILAVSFGLTCMTHCIWFLICGIVVLILMYGILFFNCEQGAGLLTLILLVILALFLWLIWIGVFDEWVMFYGWVWSWHDG